MAAALRSLVPLTRRIVAADVRAYDRRHRTPVHRRWWFGSLIVSLLLAGLLALMAALVPLAVAEQPGRDLLLAAITLVMGGFATTICFLIWRASTRRTRVDLVAGAHGFTFAERGTGLVGSIFRKGGGPRVVDAIHSTPAETQGLDAMLGTILTTPGQDYRTGGILQVRLPRPTPHIALVNARSPVLRRSSTAFRSVQRLSLEGDFDRTFTLYVPEGYERDALYIFTPDLMAALLDRLPDADAELLDGHLVVYTRRAWRLWTSDGFLGAVALADELNARLHRRTRLYADDRALASSPSIADDGHRLRGRPSAGALLTAAIPVLITAFAVVQHLLGSLQP